MRIREDDEGGISERAVHAGAKDGITGAVEGRASKRGPRTPAGPSAESLRRLTSPWTQTCQADTRKRKKILPLSTFTKIFFSFSNWVNHLSKVL